MCEITEVCSKLFIEITRRWCVSARRAAYLIGQRSCGTMHWTWYVLSSICIDLLAMNYELTIFLDLRNLPR